jgi:aspartyl-tRNA(Asn)/glutamyl-tRNA(Gln) amidotransferase subunit A
LSESEIRFATAAQLAAALRRRQISAVELAHASLDLLRTLGPRYNAVAALTPERALDEAKRADRALAKKQGGPLTGIPYGAKDLLAARGAPTTWGAPPYRDQIIGEDATVVAKLKRGGAVLAAKLAMVELAGGGGYRYPSASLQGPGRNPWNSERWSGGSSSGSGSAVSGGLVPFAIGSETSGSIGTPSAYCGVTGLRPTYGLVSRHGAMALSWTLDKLGPMARTAEDCAAVLEAIAGADAADRATSGKRFKPMAARAAAVAAKRARIGYAEEDIADHASPEAKLALEKGVAEFKRIAPRFGRAALPAMPFGPMVQTVYGSEGAEIFAELIEGPRFEQLVDARQKAGLRAALETKARDYLHAMRMRTRLQDVLGTTFHDVDVILSVGRAITATPLTQRLDSPPTTTSATPPPNRRTGNIGLIPAGNLAGVPAIFFPCGFGTDGLPVGLQLVGPPFSEPLLVALVSAYQRETDHHLKRPEN